MQNQDVRLVHDQTNSAPLVFPFRWASSISFRLWKWTSLGSCFQ